MVLLREKHIAQPCLLHACNVLRCFSLNQLIDFLFHRNFPEQSKQNNSQQNYIYSYVNQEHFKLRNVVKAIMISVIVSLVLVI